MLQLGPELFGLLNAKQSVRTPVKYGAPGLSAQELSSIEAQLGFPLPDDFKYLFQNLQDPENLLFPWSKFNKQRYDETIDWVLRGVEFDIERNNFWMERWGARRHTLAEALDVARKDFPSWPKLLPIFGHRYLVAEPCHSDNPVLSIMQTDIIHYGANLAHYLMNEFADRDRSKHVDCQPVREIAVWSEFVR